MNHPHPLRILCAEDDPAIGELLVCLLTRAGHSAVHVPDGLAAWDKVSQAPGHFDVILTDHHMPGLTGLELLERLRHVKYGGRIVVHSGSITSGDAAAYRALGAEQILAKVARLDELLQAVESGQRV